MKMKRIAMMTRAYYSYHRQVGWSCLEAMNNRSAEECSSSLIMFFCREALPQIMYEQVKEVVNNGYDLIMPIGALWTDVVTKFVRENNVKTPVVFGGVTDPVRMGILPDLKATSQITGVYREAPSWVFVARLLLIIKPSMKKIVIPFYEYAENGLIKQLLERVRDYFEAHGVSCILFPVMIVGVYPKDLNNMLVTVDTLWCFEGSFLDIYSQSLINLCNQHHVTFFSNNAAHIAYGAALVYAAPSFSSIGEGLITQACAILDEGKTTQEIGILHLPNDRKMMVNLTAAKLQGLELNEALLLAIRNELLIVG